MLVLHYLNTYYELFETLFNHVKQLEACVHILPIYSAFLGQGSVKHYNARAWAQLEGQAGLSQLLSRSRSSS